MRAILKLELRGDNIRQLTKLFSWVADECLGKGASRVVFGPMPAAAWVAEITGLDSKYGYARRFLPFQRDYSKANSVGSRGVMAIYKLDEGKVYEVKDWKTRYFCTVKSWEIQRIDKSEVEAWIESLLA